MEEKYLAQISEIIYQHLKKINYAQTNEFREFYLDMLLNIPKFISTSSEEYEQNKRTVNEVEPSEEKKYKYSDYLEHLRMDLIELLGATKGTNGLEKAKHDVEITLYKFLDPTAYDKNIEALRKAEKGTQKRLTKPHGWC